MSARTVRWEDGSEETTRYLVELETATSVLARVKNHDGKMVGHAPEFEDYRDAVAFAKAHGREKINTEFATISAYGAYTTSDPGVGWMPLIRAAAVDAFGRTSL